jgi:inosose dehydratase
MTVKIAGAPISWGVCEVPGWGFQMDRDRVLAEMVSLGYTATEFGPLGFLPVEATARVSFLAERGLAAVGGFVPAVLHNPDHDPEPEIRAELEVFRAAGASTIVLAANTGVDGYDSRPELDATGWATLLANLDRLETIAAEYGVLAVIHPHVGTMVETSDDIEKVLSGSGIGFCLDTGHMFIGGADPVAFARSHADRIKHVHAKDVKFELANKVISGELTYYQAVIEGMYVPLGQGDVDIAAIVTALQSAHFAGWYVLEQDHVVANEPAEGSGPVSDAKASVAYLRSLLGE